MSWTAPANRGDVLFLEPSLLYIHRHLNFLPSLVVADMAYINMEMQKRLREQLHVGVLTSLPPNYDLPEKVRAALLMRCAQGQKLRWLGLREDEQLHWFGVADEAEPLCSRCWQQSTCPREFSFAADDHEIALGTIPVSSSLGKKLLRQSRSWIEATQSYEKIQLGLGTMVLKNLRFASIASLLSDMVMILRARALLSQPRSPEILENLPPSQLPLDF